MGVKTESTSDEQYNKKTIYIKVKYMSKRVHKLLGDWKNKEKARCLYHGESV